MSSPALPPDHMVLCSVCGIPQLAASAFARGQLKKKHPRCRACAPNKFSNRRAGRHQSKKEAKRAAELWTLQTAGVIYELKEQVRFELIPAQRRSDKVIERACAYMADFTYIDADGRFHVEDTKGMRTDVYKLKRKLMLLVHGIRIEEV